MRECNGFGFLFNQYFGEIFTMTLKYLEARKIKEWNINAEPKRVNIAPIRVNIALKIFRRVNSALKLIRLGLQSFGFKSKNEKCNSMNLLLLLNLSFYY